MRIKVNISRWTYQLRVLYTGSGNIALIGDIRSVGNVRVGGNGVARENIANQCIYE